MQSNNIRPVRLLGPQRGTSKNSDLNASSTVDSKKTQDNVSLSQGVRDYQTKNMVSIAADTQEDASITLPSISGSILSTQEETYKPFGVQDKPKSAADCKINESASLLLLESEHVGQKKVQFALGNNARAQGNIFWLVIEIHLSNFLCDLVKKKCQKNRNKNLRVLFGCR